MSRSSKYQLLSWLTLFVFPYSLACQAEKENGFPMHSDVLRHSLLSALEAKGPDYQPRTEHRLADGAPRYTNRLILEDSPYLIQHAHNPVNWYAWGDEAFERARQEDKPVFLSIGYSTCHWCHVMERESFDNEEIAALMNEMFVCIKVDREQRPDLDEIYMTALHVTGQRGGWPMSSFLTAGRQPFYGGTYFPPQQFAALMRRVDEAWSSRREQLMETARQITEAVQRATATSGRAEAVGESAISEAASQILSAQDRQLGGAAGAPKFPHESQLLFLIDLAARRRDPALLEAIETSLDHMARGGINDQVGGGFHRYSTDSRWLVPHFEKMLYNQAHLSRAYVAGWQLTGNPFYARVARQTLDYVLREMRDDGGGFYSATDADSEGDEGLFFLWSDEQLRDELSEDDAQLAIDLFGVSSEGNFEGSNILHLPLGLEAFASSRGLEQEDLLERVDTIRETLWQAREAREHPLRDDKLLLAWNGMMITSLAAAADAFGSERYLGAAAAAAEFLWRHLRREPGKFWRVYLDGSASIPALQEDHAYFAEALLGLFDASGDEVWLHRAQEVTSGMLEQFWDSEEGGFFLSSDEIDDDLIARPKPAQDGAIPSSNSVALRVLSRLFARSGDPLYRERANGLLSAFSDGVRRSPGGYPYLLMAAGELLGGETGPDRYAAGGHLSVRTFLESDDAGPQLTLELRIAAGWHINSSLPLQDELIALELSADDPASWVLGEVDYPAAEEVVLGFQEEPLSVYRGTIHIATRLQHAAGDSEAPQATLRLRVQACNDELCLRPETLLLQVPVAAGRRLLD